jgi:ABC-type polysaccharide/polyol phosphate transport system ATPase subunit
MDRKATAISVDNVTQRFRVIHERPDSLRELFTRFFRTNAQYHDFEAVSNISFTVGTGEMLGIVGRNGSGKSTLLKIIAGVYQPTAGCVEVNGSIAPLIELGAGMHNELTGRENILLNGLLMGFSKAEMLEREQRIIDFSEIGDFVDVPLKQYSSGMYMRLAFAVATEVDPEILILDEILAVGDVAFQQKCFDRLRKFRESGKTILLVTHTLPQVVEFCDRAILMDNGHLLADGKPDEVVELFHSTALPNAHELVEASS